MNEFTLTGVQYVGQNRSTTEGRGEKESAMSLSNEVQLRGDARVLVKLDTEGEVLVTCMTEDGEVELRLDADEAWRWGAKLVQTAKRASKTAAKRKVRYDWLPEGGVTAWPSDSRTKTY